MAEQNAQTVETAKGLPTGFTSQRISLNDLSIYYIEGQESGPPLLLLSGINEVWQNYTPVLSSLSEHFHVYLYDLRGHGESERSSNADYRVVDFAHEADAFIKAVIGGPCYVAGHSLGALIAIWLAANSETPIKAVSTEDPPLFITEWPKLSRSDSWVRSSFQIMLNISRAAHQEGWATERFADRLHNEVPFRVNPHPDRPEKRLIGLAKMLQRLRAAGALPKPATAEYEAFNNACSKILAGGFATLAEIQAPKAIAHKLAEELLASDPNVLEIALSSAFCEDFDHKGTLSKVRIPLLYWSADPDIIGFLNEDDVNSLSSLVQGPFEKEIVEYSGHHIHGERPDLFVSTLKKFFTQHA